MNDNELRIKKRDEYLKKIDIICRNAYLSLNDVAAETGISYFTIIHMRSEKFNKTPRMATLRKLHMFVEKHKDALED